MDVLLISAADAARDDGAKRAFEFLYRVKACASAYRPPCLFSHEIPFARLAFLLQLKKVGKKSRSRAMLFIRLFCELSRVQLDSLEARLRPVEQPDKRTPRGTSGLGADHHVRVID